MNTRRFPAWLPLAGLGTVLGLLVFLSGRWEQGAQQSAARNHLDTVLGQANGEAPPSDNPLSSGPAGFPEFNPPSVFNLGLPQTDSVTIEESPQRYVLRVPLAEAEDSGDVQLKVTPHHIEISGQTGRQGQGGHYRSSFMQAFTTPEEVMPDQVQRRTERREDKTELVITIPKKQVGNPVI